MNLLHRLMRHCVVIYILSVKEMDHIVHIKQNKVPLGIYSYHLNHVLMHLKSSSQLFQSAHAI